MLLLGPRPAVRANAGLRTDRHAVASVQEHLGWRCHRAGVDNQVGRPGWVVPGRYGVRDLSCLALRRVVEERCRESAGIVATLGWLVGRLPGPVTARAEGAQSRDVALCELCAAESLVGGGGPPPPLSEVCRMLGVQFIAPRDVDAGYARGVWRTLLWLLGSAVTPPLVLPLRHPDGVVMGEVEVYAALTGHGREQDPSARERLRGDAAALVAESARLAALVENTAGQVRAPLDA